METMKDKFLFKPYNRVLFSSLSKQDRKLWLLKQFSLFEQEIQNFIEEKNGLVEQLYKRLKKVTQRWAFWNHKNFGPVVSREQVRHLRSWDIQNQPKLEHKDNITDALERFECYCKKSFLLLRGFREHIYTPLCDYLYIENALIDAEENRKPLDKYLTRWEHLLQNNNFNKKTLTKQSLKFLNINLPMRKTENDLVLRLIPDLIESKLQVLNGARRSLGDKTTNFDRSVTYILPPLLQKETADTVSTSPFKYQQTIQLIPQCNENCCNPSNFQQLTEELDYTRQRCVMLEAEVESLKSDCKKLEEQLESSLNTNISSKFCNTKVENILTYKESQPKQFNQCDDESYCIANELARFKASYSSQKMKYINAKKKIKILNKQLDLFSYRISNMVKNHQERNPNIYADSHIPLKINNKQDNKIYNLQKQCLHFNNDCDKIMAHSNKNVASNGPDTAFEKRHTHNLQITKEQCQITKDETIHIKKKGEHEAKNSTENRSKNNLLYKENPSKNNKTTTTDSTKLNESNEFGSNSLKESMFPNINLLKKM
ncbi:uncharacterized protein LOC100202639 isoform X3 [Hydra vulgaris]|uniref:Uncharacterized protein LOC100202639 isoform X3 n=1 Tax=Hydra vulgaris TaxID=6087 RepID=A0ABM4BKJ3_HYDVU